MATCDVCGRHVDMPYNCRHCGGTYCPEHRLPENHECAGLEQWDDPSGVFDSGFDDSVRDEGGESKDTLSSVLPDTGTGGPLAYFRGNVSYLFLAIILLVFVAESIVNAVAPQYFDELFLLTSAHPFYVWTWVTSVFSHGSFFHLFGNGIVLFFFGPVVERYIGSRRFTALYLGSGAAAGLAQVGLGLALGNSTAVLGASGAIMALLAVLTVLNPDLKVYLYFILPLPIWVLTLGYAGLSLLGVFSTASVLGGNIAHFAHLTGLLIGFAYGYHVQDEVRSPSELRFGPGGPGGPGRRL